MAEESKGQLKKNLLVLVVTGLLMGGFVLAYLAIAPKALASGKARMAGPIVPPVTGYAEGREIQFIHTEASDQEVAGILTEMMDSPVLVVAELAQTPESLLATVFVFKNGLKGRGPLGFQPDVFDNVPGTSGYRPLRMVHMVTWKSEADARVLKSDAEVQSAVRQGQISVEKSGVVVNMPFLSWPGGER